jgi:GGDEF domain-containing protein
MQNLDNLKAAVDDLQNQLREEIKRREDLERRCNLLEKLAYQDPSTGLRTETYLHARVREEIQRAIRYPSSTTLVTLCAPRSKSDVLSNLGQHLQDELRETDQVLSLSRQGLAVLLVETPEDGAHRVLQRLAGDLEQFISGYGFTVTSFPVDANLAEDFLNLALNRHNEMEERMRPNGHDRQPTTASAS